MSAQGLQFPEIPSLCIAFTILFLYILSRPSSKTSKKPAIIVILGPTASGKSDIAVHLAKTFDGEVISADSRQVYRRLDIGTGKITKKEMMGIPHHCLDIASPKKNFDVVQWKEKADKAIADIVKRGKLPIVCGGTGLYIKALIENITYPDVAPDWKLRAKLEKKTTQELFTILKKLDSVRAQTIDPHNPRRLIRAIEIVKRTSKAVPEKKAEPIYDALLLGVKKSDAELKKRIHARLLARMKKGMIAEAKKLHDQGVSWKRMNELGLEYRYLARYLQKKMTKQEMIDELDTKIGQYAKRQMTWFRAMHGIAWIASEKKAEKRVGGFLRATR